MSRRQMAVARRHRDRFVTRRLLDLLDAGTGHRQPGAEGVPVAVPDVLGDARFFHRGMKP